MYLPPRPIVSYGHTLEVTIRTTLYHSRVAAGNDRLRKLLGFAEYINLVMRSLERPKQLRVFLLLFRTFSSSFCPANKRKKKKYRNINYQPSLKFLRLKYFRLEISSPHRGDRGYAPKCIF